MQTETWASNYAKLISNWTKDLTVFTNGPSTFSTEQTEHIKKHKIKLVETEIDRLEHEKGYLHTVTLKDGSLLSLKALYHRPAFVQHSDIPERLGCELSETGHIKIDAFQKTTVPGIYASGTIAYFCARCPML